MLSQKTLLDCIATEAIEVSAIQQLESSLSIPKQKNPWKDLLLLTYGRLAEIQDLLVEENSLHEWQDIMPQFVEDLRDDIEKLR